MRHAHGGGVPCGTAAGGRRNALRCTFHGKPYKFPCDVLGALGADVPEDEFEAMRLLQEKTGVPAPASLAGLREKPVRFTQVVEKDGIRAAALAL